MLHPVKLRRQLEISYSRGIYFSLPQVKPQPSLCGFLDLQSRCNAGWAVRGLGYGGGPLQQYCSFSDPIHPVPAPAPKYPLSSATIRRKHSPSATIHTTQCILSYVGQGYFWMQCHQSGAGSLVSTASS